MTRDIFIQIISQNIFYMLFLLALTVLIYYTVWSIVLNLGFHLLGAKPRRIYPAILIMVLFSFSKQIFPIKAYGLVMAALTGFILAIVGRANFIKTIWVAILILMTTGVADLLVMPMAIGNESVSNFFLKTIYGNLSISLIEAIFPLVLLFVNKKFKKISLVPPIEKIDLFTGTAAMTFCSLFYLFYSNSMSLYLSLKTNSPHAFSDLISQWIAAVAAFCGCFLLLNLLKRKYENKQYQLEVQREHERQQHEYEQRINTERITQLQTQNLALTRLSERLAEGNIGQQEVKIDEFKGSIDQLISQNNILIDQAKASTPPPPAKATKPDNPDELSKSEIELVQLVALNKSTREIAAALLISESSVIKYISNLYDKLRLKSNRVDIALYALKYGFVKREEIELDRDEIKK